MGCLYFMLYNSTVQTMNIEFIKSFMKMKHRGLNGTEFNIINTPNISLANQDLVRSILSKREIAEYRTHTFITGYHRMSINDTSKDGMQPFEDPIVHKMRYYPDLRNRPKRTLICNGEIYNYKELKEKENFTNCDLQSNSDVEIILPMYIRYGIDETLKKLNGDYSFVLTENLNTFDLKNINIFAVRDLLGTKPLYMIKNKKFLFYMFISELKGIPDEILKDDSYIIQEVPPGTYWSYKNSIIDKNQDEFIRYVKLDYYRNLDNCIINTTDPDTLSNLYNNIKTKLTHAVVSRYNSSDVPIGVLLSGGFDSSIILGILIYYLYCNNHDFKNIPIHAFTIGNLDSDDVKSAIKCVEFLENQYEIDIIHHIVDVDLNINKIIERIDNVIYNLETYDPYTIRTSIPYTYLFDYIKNKTNAKVLLTGEGLDELCGYHQLFNGNDNLFQNKSIDLLENMNKFDLLRCDKLASFYNLELRHPFLDTSFIEYILSMHPKLKIPQVYNSNGDRIEKYIVRKSFDFSTNDIFYLDSDILWRDIGDIRNCFGELNILLNDYFEKFYTDKDLYNYIVNNTNETLTLIQPNTKEEMHYKIIFNNKFGFLAKTVSTFWTSIINT